MAPVRRAGAGMPARPCCLVVSLLAGTASVSAEQQRVLFVGNSFSFVSGSVWSQYKTIAEACIPGLQVTTTFKGDGGQTLHGSANDPGTRAAVRDGQYDLLVLQDQSELAEDGTGDVKNFYAPEAKKKGARMGFYETWATPDADGKNLTKGTMMRKAYYEGLKSVAESVGAKAMIARAGEAFLEVQKDFSYDWEVPGFLNLLAGDYDHPSTLGLNLVAWVMTLRYNNHRFGASGCDVRRVPNVQGQSDDMKARFARIACELAYVCPRAAPAPAPKLCDIAAKMQGRWVSKGKASRYECESLRKQGAPWLAADCTYTETWDVEGTEVLQTSQGKTLQHHLRVSQYGQMCIIKFVPLFTYVAELRGDKLQFNDCRVWTRPAAIGTAVPDECWCTKSAEWKDGEGESCAAYEQGQRKGDGSYCEVEGTESITRFSSLKARQACSGCGKCTPPPSAAVRSLTMSAVPGSDVELV